MFLYFCPIASWKRHRCDTISGSLCPFVVQKPRCRHYRCDFWLIVMVIWKFRRTFAPSNRK